MVVETTTFLGPVRVVEVALPRVRIALPDGEYAATLALSSPYEPAVGDIVLAIGQEEKYFILGVIAGTGRTVFAPPGDIEFRTRGKIGLVATKGIELDSPKVAIRAGRLELLARSITERFDEACRWVKGLFRTRASRQRIEVLETAHLRAGRIVEQAEEEVKIDGRKIMLG